MWTCNGWDNQQWYFDGGHIKSQNGQCLDVHDEDYKSEVNGALVQMWDCNGQENQNWYFDGNQIKSQNGKCLDIHVDDIYNDGAKV